MKEIEELLQELARDCPQKDQDLANNGNQFEKTIQRQDSARTIGNHCVSELARERIRPRPVKLGIPLSAWAEGDFGADSNIREREHQQPHHHHQRQYGTLAEAKTPSPALYDSQKKKYACRFPGCSLSANFNFPRVPGRVYCSAHKLPGMINATRRQPTCPNFVVKATIVLGFTTKSFEVPGEKTGCPSRDFGGLDANGPLVVLSSIDRTLDLGEIPMEVEEKEPLAGPPVAAEGKFRNVAGQFASPFPTLAPDSMCRTFRRGDRKIFSCIVCSTEFGRRADFNRHSRIHTGVKPYSCWLDESC